MKEFAEHSVETRWGTLDLAHKLEVPDWEPPGVCRVTHPDAGGPCEEPAVYVVYGLLFCEAHGLEAYHGMMARYWHESAREAERPDNPEAAAPHPEIARLMEGAAKRFSGLACRHEDALDHAAREAYPFREDRVEDTTLSWDHDTSDCPPFDYWSYMYFQVCSSMYQACEERLPGLVEDLEPLRERAAAQRVFAEVVTRRKMAERHARKREAAAQPGS